MQSTEERMHTIEEELDKMIKDFEALCLADNISPEQEPFLTLKGEEFLQAAKNLLLANAADFREPRVAIFIPSIYYRILNYPNTQVNGALWTQTRLGTQFTHSNSFLLLFVKFCKRFIQEVLKPWFLGFLKSVDLHEQLHLFELEFMQTRKGFSIEMYKYRILFDLVLKHAPRLPQAELCLLAQEIDTLLLDCENTCERRAPNALRYGMLNAITSLKEIKSLVSNAMDALAMALHPRLGTESALHLLSRDTIEMIGDFSHQSAL